MRLKNEPKKLQFSRMRRQPYCAYLTTEQSLFKFLIMTFIANFPLLNSEQTQLSTTKMSEQRFPKRQWFVVMRLSKRCRLLMEVLKMAKSICL